MSKSKLLVGLSVAVVLIVVIISLLNGESKEAVKQEAEQTKQEGPKSTSSVHVSAKVEQSCMSCHAVDNSGKLARIEYVRKSPEGWSDTIARMERNHGVKLTDADREQIIEDLSRERGLAPEEAEQVQYWLANKQSFAEPTPANVNLQNSCMTCHATGRFMAQRRTEEEWKNLKDFHLVSFPSTYLNHRHMDWPKEAEDVLRYLAEQYPEETPEWKEWKGKEFDPTGAWKVVGFQGTKGFYIGDSTFAKNGNGFTETKSVRYVYDQSSVQSSGDVQIYSGYMLRAHYMKDGKKVNGVYNMAENGTMIIGDWSEQKDQGIAGEETYYKVQTEKPEVIFVTQTALKKGSTNQITLYGMNLNKLKKEDLQLPAGVTVDNLTAKSSEEVQLSVRVSDAAQIGSFAIGTPQTTVRSNLVVYDNVDTIKVTPDYAIARIGGAGPMDKVSVQFVAYAYSNGKDGKPGTADDLSLGPVEANWTFEPFPAGSDPQNTQYMGTLDKNGLFTPQVEGINPKRTYTQENLGTATVIATATIDGRTVTAESHLVSTVPDYNNLIH
ncbi:quinohemoprotein amine dehydrogenase subunit alpha [Brevibacillus sp. NRS-1366]|uniref:quinohemoprotein amine dehydrogenase subunit alpha n=1 Tax=Brevibacillus sp. NRS-1366 TaxID=3233899 RepID=UPI003D1DD764